MEHNRKIDTIDHWEKAKLYLRENNYRIFQLQYDVYSPEGLHAIFISRNRKNIEIVTFNKEVQKVIVKY